MSKKLFSNLLILSLIVQASIGLFAFPNQAKATGTIYYVDNTITDTNVGSATPDCTNYDPVVFTCSGGSASAYKTVADINAGSFSPDDQILFRKGQTWREQLTVPSSGISGHPITFGAFGTGANPIISGSDIVSSWSQTNGSVTQNNKRFSFAVNTAFVDFGAVGSLTPYLGAKLTITDSASKKIVGYIKAVGTGETYSSELLSNTAYNDTTGVNHFSSNVASVAGGQAGNALQVTPTSDYGNASQPFTTIAGGLYHALIYWKNGTASGNVGLGQVASPYSGFGGNYGYSTVSWTQVSVYGTAFDTGTNVVFGCGVTGSTCLFDTTSAKQVLTPSTTGVTITSTANGSTYNWTSEDSGFNRNDSSGYTYTVSGVGGSTYVATVTAQPYVVTQGSVRLTLVANLAVLTAAGEWWYDATNQKLYVWTTDSANPTTHTMEAGARLYSVDLDAKTYVTIDGFTLSGANENGVVMMNGANYATISNNTVKNIGHFDWGTGIHFKSATNGVADSNDISAAYTGIMVEGWYSPLSSNNTIRRNTIHDVDNLGTTITNGNVGQPTNTLFEYNNVYNCMSTSDDGPGIGTYHAGTGTIIRYNTVHNCGTASMRGSGINADSWSAPVQIYGNLVYLNNYGGINLTASGHLVYGNTLYHNNENSADAGEISIFTMEALAGSSETIKNNILVASAGKHLIVAGSGNTAGHTINYNDFYGGSATPFNWGGTDYNFANYKTTSSQDANSLNSDPKFTTDGSNFSLLSTSPAIDSGISLGDTYKLGLNPNSVWPSSVNTLDQTLNGLGWDIGAYVYTENTPPTVTLTAPTDGTTVSGSSVTLSATASDNSAVAGVQFKFDTNTNIGAEDTTSPYGVTWDSTSIADGTHTLIAVARDTYGNYATSSAVSVSVHNVVASGGGGGTTYPSIYQVAVSSTTPTSAIISWRTDYNTNSEVDYGTSTVYGLVKTDSAATTTHIILLNNLVSATTYQFKVKSSLNGITASSNNSSFTTLTAGGQTITPTPPSVGVPTTSLPLPTPSGMRLINNNGTFYLIQNGVLQGITGPGILNSYGFEFKDASAATTDDLALPQGGLLLPANGALVKSNQDKTVYLISGGQRHAFTSAGVFTGLGFKFSSVLLVTNPELQALPEGLDISDPSSAHLDGVNINDQGTIYWINNRIRYSYPSIEVYNSWNIDNNFTRVVPANAADLALPVGEVIISRIIQ